MQPNADGSEGDEPTPTTSAPIETPISTIIETVPPPTQAVSLIVWTTPEFSNLTEVPAGQLLAQQLDTFDNSKPNISLTVDFKASSGPASGFNYVRTGQAIAPTVLPDLMMLPAGLLNAAAEESILVPLDDPASGITLLDQAMIDDLFPAANRLGRLGDSNSPLMGYPFLLTQVTQLAYASSEPASTPPTLWRDFDPDQVDLLFPANSPDAARLLLQLYLDAGGTLSNESGQPDLQVEPLVEALTLLEQSRESGVIEIESSTVETLSQTWDRLVGGSANVVVAEANHFHEQRRSGTNFGFAAVPGISGPLTPQVSGWVWVITTSDTAKQQAAIELLSWLVNPDNLGAWSLEANQIPARRSAIQAWGIDDPYLLFLEVQLEQSAPFPLQATNAIMEALSSAMTDVIALSSQPISTIAEEAVRRVRP